MKEYRIWKIGLVIALVLTLALTGCGGGGGDAVVNPDGDGIPDAVDAKADDAVAM